MQIWGWRDKKGKEGFPFLSWGGMKRMSVRYENGFTFIEVIVAVTIIGILAAVAIIKMNGTTDVELAAATRKVISDIQYAQDLAMTTGNHVKIQFDLDNNSYRLLWSNGTAVPNIMGSGDFIVHYGSGNFPHVSITNTGLNQGILAFDAIGQPYSDSNLIASSILVVELNEEKKIDITPYTGKVYLETP